MDKQMMIRINLIISIVVFLLYLFISLGFPLFLGYSEVYYVDSSIFFINITNGNTYEVFTMPNFGTFISLIYLFSASILFLKTRNKE